MVIFWSRIDFLKKFFFFYRTYYLSSLMNYPFWYNPGKFDIEYVLKLQREDS